MSEFIFIFFGVFFFVCGYIIGKGKQETHAEQKNMPPKIKVEGIPETRYFLSYDGSEQE